MAVGSLFSGVGGFDLAAERCGMRVAWQSEIDPHASAVLRRHWPDVPNHGDIRLMRGGPSHRGSGARYRADVPGRITRRMKRYRRRGKRTGRRGMKRVQSADVITAGFPCQDLSVAGKRAGLAGERSGLYFEIIRLVREMREATDGRCPELVVLENVPGLLSSQRGRDFAVVLRELRQLGAMDIGWRVLDARHFGVPQRRRRVFVVADLGGRRAGQILFESESGAGDSAPCRETGQTATRTLTSGSGGGRYDRQPIVAFNGGQGAKARSLASGPMSPPLKAAESGSNRTPLIAAPLTAGSGVTGNAPGRRREDDENLVAFDWQQHGNHSAESFPSRVTERTPAIAHAVTTHMEKGGGPTTDNCVTHSLTAEGHDASEDGTGRGTPLVTNTTDYQGDRVIDERGTWPALSAQGGNNGGGAGALAHRRATMAVRRLMPVECLRLQGFPDDHLDLEPELSDSAKYRCVGNAVAVPVVEWLLSRLAETVDS